MEKQEFVLQTIVDCVATFTPNDKYDDVDYDCSVELSFAMNKLFKFIFAKNAEGLSSHVSRMSLEECGEEVICKFDFSLGKEI